MSQEIVARAGEIINSKAGYKDEFGMEGYATIAVMDEFGYPTASTYVIFTANGINWLTFATGSDRDIVKRINKNNRASVCINSTEYNITLVGTFEIINDPEIKREMWIPNSAMNNHWSGPEDPQFCVLRFTTERYNLFVDYKQAKGTLKKIEKKAVPSLIPLFQFDRQCEEAIELYKKAFGAEVKAFVRFSDSANQDWSAFSEDEKELIYHAQMQIGNQRIILCDNLFTDLPRGHSIYPVITFETADEVKAAYDVLADGATIISPINSTSYSPCVVSFIDKFGIQWDLMSHWKLAE